MTMMMIMMMMISRNDRFGRIDVFPPLAVFVQAKSAAPYDVRFAGEAPFYQNGIVII